MKPISCFTPAPSSRTNVTGLACCIVGQHVTCHTGHGVADQWHLAEHPPERGRGGQVHQPLDVVAQLGDDGLGVLQGGAVWELGIDHEVALVLVGDEADRDHAKALEGQGHQPGVKQQDQGRGADEQAQGLQLAGQLRDGSLQLLDPLVEFFHVTFSVEGQQQIWPRGSVTACYRTSPHVTARYRTLMSQLVPPAAGR